MATTTNYGWTTPDDTALVKDGAAAIRTLGSSVDTTTKNLNPETTLGDISYRSSTANVKTRLGLGTAGQVLTVNSGANAPEWATPASGGMTLISTTTLTGASITLSSIPATYNNLQVVIRDLRPTTDNDSLYVRFNGDTGSRYATANWSTAPSQLTLSSDAMTLMTLVDNGASDGLIVINIPDYTNAVTFKMLSAVGIANHHSTPADVSYKASNAFFNQIGAINSLTFFMNSDFVSGTVLLYGVK